MIDETRAISEREMLADMKYLVEQGGDIEYRDHQGATPVRYFILFLWKNYLNVLVYHLIFRNKNSDY